MKEQERMSEENLANLVRMIGALGDSYKDENFLTLIMSILKTDDDCEQMKEWLLHLRQFPTMLEIQEKAAEISGDYGEQMSSDTYNSMLANLEVNTDIREVLMGHSSGKVNVETYTHYKKQTLLDVANRL